ncbi:MAG: hypothetical protein RR220_08840 [Bacteroidaceae bacterium]
MKKALFLLAILPVFLFMACSSIDNNPKIPITKSSIIGKWSTGTKGIHKYLEFESNGTGCYASYNEDKMEQNYFFSYEISNEIISITITHANIGKELVGSTKLWNCTLAGYNLIIENGTENGVYKRIEEKTIQ